MDKLVNEYRNSLLDKFKDILRVGTEHMTIQMALTASVSKDFEVLFSPCYDRLHHLRNLQKFAYSVLILVVYKCMPR